MSGSFAEIEILPEIGGVKYPDHVDVEVLSLANFGGRQWRMLQFNNRAVAGQQVSSVISEANFGILRLDQGFPVPMPCGLRLMPGIAIGISGVAPVPDIY